MTKKCIRNDAEDVERHLRGHHFRHKFYEYMRLKMQTRKKKLESDIRFTKKMIEKGRMGRLRLGARNSNNVLCRGFLRSNKFMKLIRYSNLTVLNYKSVS